MCKLFTIFSLFLCFIIVLWEEKELSLWDALSNIFFIVPQKFKVSHCIKCTYNILLKKSSVSSVAPFFTLYTISPFFMNISWMVEWKKKRRRKTEVYILSIKYEGIDFDSYSTFLFAFFPAWITSAWVAVRWLWHFTSTLWMPDSSMMTGNTSRTILLDIHNLFLKSLDYRLTLKNLLCLLVHFSSAKYDHFLNFFYNI